jgi:hypothetical protein
VPPNMLPPFFRTLGAAIVIGAVIWGIEQYSPRYAKNVAYVSLLSIVVVLAAKTTSMFTNLEALYRG